jgi:hypothetical protein
LIVAVEFLFLHLVETVELGDEPGGFVSIFSLHNARKKTRPALSVEDILWIFFRRQMIQFSNALVFTKVPVAFL